MKRNFALYFLLLVACPLFSQQRFQSTASAPLDTLFPFNIPLVTIDSAKTLNSKDLLAISKNEKQPTVIAFWLTTCIPCQRELATYTANYAAWKNQANFNLFAISTDFPKNFRKIASIVGARKFPFPVYWDRDRLFRSVMPGELNGLPQVFVFDKNGQLAYRHKGFRPGDELTLLAKIKELQ
jgi:peroxiredoxin